MTEITDELLAKRLREVFDARRITVRQASADLGIPYRTLQNQLNGRNKMPAATLARVLIYLELPLELLIRAEIALPARPLANALLRAFGTALPTIADDMSVLQPVPRTPEELRRQSLSVAFVLREAYKFDAVPEELQAVVYGWVMGSQ